MKQALYIYNIFPRIYRDTDKWRECALRAKYMGFNTIYINAFFKCGSSRSIYSICDYYSFDRLSFQKGCNPKKEIIAFNKFCKENNLLTLADLVINHTAPESPLIKQHPDWYRYDDNNIPIKAGTPGNDGFVTWTDTAKLYYDKNDENGLKEYMLNVCKYYLKLGFDGFRCDVANHVAPEAWDYIISEIRKIKPDAIFIGESFMCSVDTMIRMGKSGFDYIFNSSKWWNYDGDWLLEQYNATKNHVASLSFPDNHDTERLIKTCNYDYDLFLQRIYFTALFSKGFFITDGLEFACSKQLNVVSTRSNDFESTDFDFVENIKDVLSIKSKFKSLHEESDTKVLYNNKKYICIQKCYEDETVLIIINKTKSKIKARLRWHKLINRKQLVNGEKKRTIKIEPMQVTVLEITNK